MHVGLSAHHPLLHVASRRDLPLNKFCISCLISRNIKMPINI